MKTFKRLLLLFGVLFAGNSGAAELLKVGDAVPEIPLSATWYGGALQKIHNDDGKVLLLYFTKPGCPSCDEFAPHLYRLLLKNAAQLRAIAVVPGRYSETDVANYARDRAIGDYPIVYDKGNNFAPAFIGKIDKFPYIALVAADGKLLWYGRAKFHEQITAEVERALAPTPNNLVGEKPDAAPEDAVALVIGTPNSLLSPIVDSTQIAETLGDRGYAVTLLQNAEELTPEKIKETIAEITPQDDGLFCLFFSGDARASTFDLNKTEIKFKLPVGEITLREIDQAIKEKNSQTVRIVYIIDAMQEDGLKNLSGAQLDDVLFADIIKNVGAVVAPATVILSAARWDQSLLTSIDKAGTQFAQALTDELAKNEPITPYELWRQVRDALGENARQTGNLQSPAGVFPENFLLK